MRFLRHRGRRGQAAVEMALIAPVLLLLTLGSADLGRAFYFNIETSGASRAGMRSGILGGTATDIGAIIRAEPNTAILNNDVTWGPEGPSGANSCGTGKLCGDASGCISTSFTGSQQVACFAVRTCTYDSSAQTYTVGCTGNTGWQTRPTSQSSSALQVKVVYKFRPATPVIINMAPNGGNFYLTGLTTGIETY